MKETEDATKWNGKAWFVWMPGLKGPQPQIWPHGQYTKDQVAVQPLQRHLMTEADIALHGDSSLALSILAEKYPFDPSKGEGNVKE